MTKSQRTRVAVSLGRMSLDLVGMTGTPVIDSKTAALQVWLAAVTPYPVNDRTFLVALGEMIIWSEELEYEAKHFTEVATWRSEEERKQYCALIPIELGGTHLVTPSPKDHAAARKLCADASLRRMVELVMEHKVFQFFKLTHTRA